MICTEFLADAVVPQRPRNRSERLQVFGSPMDRGKQREHEVHGTVIEGSKLDRIREPGKQSTTSVRSSIRAWGMAMPTPYAGRAELFTLDERIVHSLGIEVIDGSCVIADQAQQPRLVQNAGMRPNRATIQNIGQVHSITRRVNPLFVVSGRSSRDSGSIQPKISVISPINHVKSLMGFVFGTRAPAHLSIPFA